MFGSGREMVLNKDNDCARSAKWKRQRQKQQIFSQVAQNDKENNKKQQKITKHKTCKGGVQTRLP
jgi:hypothetical protein